MGVSAMDIGHQLKAAREELGYTQGELGRAVELGREAIGHIEDSSRTVKVGELCNIARELMRPITYFLTDEESEELAVVAYRGSQAPTTEVRRTELWLRQRMADLGELHYLFGPGQNGETNVAELRGGPVQQRAARAATEQRKLLGIEQEPIGDLCDLIEDGLGMPVFGRKAGTDTDFCGLLLFDPRDHSAAMLVNASISYTSRRRFTIAHELGHYLWKVALQDFSPDVLFWSATGEAEDSDEERFANAFAAHFLAPADATKSFVAAGELDMSDAECIMQVAAHFGLSFQATTYRLQALGLIGAEVGDALREATSPTALRSFRREWEPFAEMSHLFRRMVIDAYFEDLLSAGRCAEMLDMTAAEFIESIDEANKDVLASKWVTSG